MVVTVTHTFTTAITKNNKKGFCCCGVGAVVVVVRGSIGVADLMMVAKGGSKSCNSRVF